MTDPKERKLKSGWPQMVKFTFALLLGGATFSPSLAFAETGTCYHGVNISGAEYGDAAGVYGTNYTYPSERTVQYFAQKGMNIVRLPFRWERLQPLLGNALDETELSRLDEAVELIRSHNMSVVLDPHNFGYYGEVRMMSEGLTAADFANFWTRIAIEFANQDDVFFGLMNEPHDIPTDKWLTSANEAIAGIRATGANNLILVPGTNWSGASSWENPFTGGSNADLMAKVKDPFDNFAFEVHQYMDEDFSGTHDSCPQAKQAEEALSNFTRWLKNNSFRGVLGEFGGSASEECLAGLQAMINVMDSAPEQWLGWTYWAAGDWWPEDEANNIQPTAKGDRPQLAAILAAKETAVSRECETQN